jgi:ferredoxin-NADP reductase
MNVEITVSHVGAVHSAAHEAKERAAAAPPDSGRHTAALEAAKLLGEVRDHLLELIPEEQRAAYPRMSPMSPNVP